MSPTQSNPSSVINDFSIVVATVNGSGSQTSNAAIMRAIFKMGVPVSGKNLFPSNIQGLPTWYTIRVSKDGYVARRDEQEVVIAINPATFVQDQANVKPGGVFFYDDSIKLSVTRQDITAYPMPIKLLTRESGAPSNLRDYIANMVYVGVVAHILGIELEMLHQALDFHFKGKQKPIEMNYSVVKAAADWAAKNLVKTDPFKVERMDKTGGLILADGNTAAALGALYGGVQLVAWYPITPATSLAEGIMEYAPMLRKDTETGKSTVVIVQAEDELAAVGMTVGAGWGGLRAMTSTSGPGISLMAEYIGLAYFTEVPIVIWDVQRVGPATGLPTRTSQGDIMEAAYISHGDTQHIILFPGSVNECFEFGWKALDVAERLQTPVFVLSDLDFGMNQWMTDPFCYPDVPMDRGKVLWEEDLEKLNGNWGRYADIDNDGIPYRTLPGNRHPRAAYFTRGTGHDEKATYSELPEVWERVLNRIKKKFYTARSIIPPPVVDKQPGAEIGIIALGSTDATIYEARHQLTQRGIASDYMRLRAYPFNDEVAEFICQHPRNYVIELNRDGQLNQLLTVEVPTKCTSLISLAHLDGLPLTAKWVVNAILAEEGIEL